MFDWEIIMEEVILETTTIKWKVQNLDEFRKL